MQLIATIDAVSTATPRTLQVRLRLDAPFAFAPGQAALVGASGARERRPYSIAVGPEEAARSGCLEFLIGLGTDGTPGPHLPSVEPGERLVQPQGAALLSHTYDPLFSALILQSLGGLMGSMPTNLDQARW
jgi:NAD(P)H-flavin reductase